MTCIAPEAIEHQRRRFTRHDAQRFKGSIKRELPAQFDDVTIADMLEIAKGGDAAARRCYKLLNEPPVSKEVGKT